MIKDFLIKIVLLVIGFNAFQNLFSQEYFQQEVNYQISVTLNDTNHAIFGKEQIEYINNSPDTLHFIYFHLWPNAYKNLETEFFQQKREQEYSFIFDYYKEYNVSGYIDSLDFKVNNKPAEWQLTKNIDIAVLFLPQKLLPGDTIAISTPFYVKIPLSVSRLGYYNQSYQLTQWYPKPAVYDKFGWHPMSYLDQGEFYSEFGTYNVSITLPENYVVGASGELITQKERSWLDSLAAQGQAFLSGDTTLKKGNIKSSTKTKTLNYKAVNAHDFAWFAAKNYHVLKGNVKLPNSGNEVKLYAMFFNEGKSTWEQSIEYMHDAIYFYSEKIGDYPYETCTAVDGGASWGSGMEYPGITIVHDNYDTLGLEEVIVHEIGHNWFYGTLASNERENPWMDEGMNTFYETLYTKSKYPDLKFYQYMGYSTKFARFFGFEKYKAYLIAYLYYLLTSKENGDLPPSLHSDEFDSGNYFAMTYYKSALSMFYLKSVMGVSDFDSLMQSYFDKWKFKHPSPDDFYMMLEQYDEIDLSFFEEYLIESNRHIDFKIKSAEKYVTADSVFAELQVNNNTKSKIPVQVGFYAEDSLMEVKTVISGKEKERIALRSKNITKIKIDPNIYTIDYNRNNNTYDFTKLFSKSNKLKLKLLPSIDDEDKNELYLQPLVTWNVPDNFMPGVIFHNNCIRDRKIKFLFAPQYSLANNRITGFSHIKQSVNFYDRFITRWENNLLSRSYGYFSNIPYFRFEYHARLLFKKKIVPIKLKNEFHIRLITASDVVSLYMKKNVWNNFLRGNYIYGTEKTVNPYKIDIGFELGPKYGKLWGEGKYKFSYYPNTSRKVKNKGLNLRLFAGGFAYNKSNNGQYNIRMSGRSGFNDYTYDHVFFERSNFNPNTFWGSMFVPGGGGFASTTVSQSNKFLTGFTATADFPGRIPVSLYGGIGTFSGIKKYPGNGVLVAEGGLKLSVFNDMISVYLPVTGTDDVHIANTFYVDRFWHRIRFSLSLESLYEPLNINHRKFLDF